MLKKLLLSLLLLAVMLPAHLASAHDYHASITDATYNPRTKSLQVAVKVFRDDLEDALSRQAKTKVKYSSTSEEVQKQLANYVKPRLAFEVEKGKALPVKFVGSEEETDVVWLYVEVPMRQTSFAQLYVKNAILTDLFSDQMNIVNVSHKGKVESVMMQRGDAAKKLTF
ncbi:DUF6702 family protein [Pontibacter sp. CAU 1760]